MSYRPIESFEGLTDSEREAVGVCGSISEVLLENAGARVALVMMWDHELRTAEALGSKGGDSAALLEVARDLRALADVVEARARAGR